MIFIYGKENCLNCKTAKNLAQLSKEEYTELKVEEDFKIEELFEKIGYPVREFPQVFVNDLYIGNINEFRKFLNDRQQEFDFTDFDI